MPELAVKIRKKRDRSVDRDRRTIHVAFLPADYERVAAAAKRDRRRLGEWVRLVVEDALTEGRGPREDGRP